MKVIKFGGSSLSSSENILKVLNIIKQYDDKTVIVLSAFGNTTNNIIDSGELASKKNKGYKDLFKKIESYHFGIIRDLVDINFQVKILTHVQKKFLDLENILDGIYGVGELSKSILDKISSRLTPMPLQNRKPLSVSKLTNPSSPPCLQASKHQR